jgi:hypothetical protein
MQVNTVPGGEEFVGNAGSVTITAPAPRIVVLRMKGHVTADTVPPQVTFLNKLAIREPTDFFYDLWEMTSYDSALRVDLTDYHLRNRASLRSLHTVAQSKLVRMGVTVANVALRVIVQHNDPSAFNTALADAIAMRKTG